MYVSINIALISLGYLYVFNICIMRDIDEQFADDL